MSKIVNSGSASVGLCATPPYIPDKKSVVKSIQCEWVLITYDIPSKAKHTRYEFLSQAASLGAQQHSESVYLMPYTETTLKMANALAGEIGAKVYVWVSEVKDMAMAVSLTSSYEKYLQGRCDEIAVRVQKIKEHLEKKRLTFALKMSKKTNKLLLQAVRAAKAFESQEINQQLEKLVAEFTAVFQGKG